MKKLLLSLFALLLFSFCFVSCSQRDDSQELTEGTAVRFTLADMASGATTRAALDKDMKVRVTVYKTGAQSSAHYVASKDYTAQADGSLLAADGTELLLTEGTYDFYAVTPALAVVTAGEHPTVAVEQQTDFAVSLTTEQKITRWNSGESASSKQRITLNELARKCAKVNFGMDIAEDVASSITDTKITGVTLTRMPNALTAVGTHLAPGSGEASLTLVSGLFATNAENPRQSSGGTVLLPKTNELFSLSVKAQFNGVAGITTSFPASSVTMSFDSGKEYTFTVRLTKDKLGNPVAGLWVTVSKWHTSDQDYNLGGVPSGPVHTQLIGEWTNITWGDVNLGGVPTGPVITGVSGWWNNIYYNPHLGGSDANSNN